MSVAFPALAEPSFLRGGNAGFVVTEIRYGLAKDASETGACPAGMSSNVEEIYTRTTAGKRRRGETDEAYAARLKAGTEALSSVGGQNLCQHPEAGGPDPHFKSVTRADIPVEGIDLDGHHSTQQASAPGSCPHPDFPGVNGERGVDNQFYRVVGCIRSFQSTGLSNSFSTEMFTGSWGILITLNGVDNLENDDHIEVGFFSNADPIRLSPTRQALDYATYAKEQDPRFRSSARGRIKNGVITTEPTNVRFRHVVNSIRLERELRDARVQLKLSPDGKLEGYLAGYTPLEAMYNTQFGFRDGKDGNGNPANPRLILGSSNGAARVLGYTCHGAYHALQQHADGHPDPTTGQCTSISTQYRITAIPAFVVDTATQSRNAKLKEQVVPNAR